MKNKLMKQNKASIKSLVFGWFLLLMGMGGAYASMSCEGTVYLKIPDSWASAYAVAGGQKTAFTPSTFTGWSKNRLLQLVVLMMQRNSLLKKRVQMIVIVLSVFAVILWMLCT